MKRNAQFIKLGPTNYPAKKVKPLRERVYVIYEEEIVKNREVLERQKWDAIWASKPYGKNRMNGF